MATSPSPIVPAEHLIVVAMHVQDHARMCEQVLSQAGFPVRVCPDGVTAADVIEAVETYHPHLLVIDDDIEWAEGVHVVLRLHVDPEFAFLPILMLLHRPGKLPAAMQHEHYQLNGGLSKPFASTDLVWSVKRIFQGLATRRLPTVSAPAISSKRTEVEWQIWKQQLPPFALFDAARDGDQVRVVKLIAQGVDVNARNGIAMTALHCAITRNNADVIHLLLDSGAEINARDCYGNTPLLRAVFFSYMETMRLLLERGADPNLPDHYKTLSTPYQTALQMLLDRGAREQYREIQEEGVKLLLAFGADPNAVSRLAQTTPLQSARKHNLPTIERLLREYGARE